MNPCILFIEIHELLEMSFKLPNDNSSLNQHRPTYTVDENIICSVISHGICHAHTSPVIMIETDIWTFRNLQNKILDGFCFSKNLFIIDYATVKAVVPLTQEVIGILSVNGILRIFYSCFSDNLPIQDNIAFVISDDEKSATFFTKRCELLYTTIVKLCDNFCLKERSLEQNISLSHFNNDIDYRKKQSIEILNFDKSDDSVVKIFSTELQLSKLEISYLIGKNGYWINSLRDVTKTTIKIMPILKRLDKKELNSPTNIFQTVIVTGTLTELVQAIVFIESTLTNMT